MAETKRCPKCGQELYRSFITFNAGEREAYLHLESGRLLCGRYGLNRR